MNKILTIITVLLLCIVNGYTQDDSSLKPDKSFVNENYAAAIKGYKKQLISNTNDYHATIQLGKCYINSYIDREKSIYYLEKIKEVNTNNFEALHLLGQAYHLNYKFDLAIQTYQTLIDSTMDSLVIKDAIRQIEMCENAKKLIMNPVNVTLKNLGDTINSKAPDYNAYIDESESILVFSSKRKKRNKAEGPSPDGFYTSDVFMSYFKETAWQKLKSQSKVCTPVSEEIVGLSANGKLMFLNVHGRGVTGEMVISTRKSGSFKEPIKVEKTVNTNATEMTASVSKDKERLYYGSDRADGKGMFDIYEAKRLPDQSWAISASLDAVNTPYNELYPQLSPDEKTLYFASEGHNSMGGYDLFKSEWDAENLVWGEPQNLGYPINTPDDDMHFSINAEGSMGYIASFRKDSRGGLDIYSVAFNDVELKKSVITGKIYTQAIIDYTGVPNNINKSKTTVQVPLKEVFIEVHNKLGDLAGIYSTNPKTGKFIIILPPGTYSINFLVSGYKTTKFPLIVFGKGAFQAFTSKDFTIEPIDKPISVPYSEINK